MPETPSCYNLDHLRFQTLLPWSLWSKKLVEQWTNVLKGKFQENHSGGILQSEMKKGKNLKQVYQTLMIIQIQVVLIKNSYAKAIENYEKRQLKETL